MEHAATANGGAALSEADWEHRVAEARRRGDHLLAYDLATQALDAWPESIGLHYQAILALARAGALQGARERYDQLERSGLLQGISDPTRAADVAALDGRLWKDLAKRSEPAEAARCDLLSAEAYASAYERFGGFFPAINAATMYLAAGHKDSALAYARTAQKLAREAPPGYWAAATEAEASLILGSFDRAAECLRTAATFDAGSLDKLATTRRQLAWVIDLVGGPAEVLDNLPKPRVLNWNAGRHSDTPTFPGTFGRGDTVIAFGPLLSEADIAVARAFLEAGNEVNLVLPCEPALISASSLVGNNHELRRQFETILERAASIVLVTPEGGPFEPAARLLCRQQAQGLARLRAASLAVAPELCVVGEGEVRCVALPGAEYEPEPTPGEASFPAELVRRPHAILFGDVRGFSRLTEAEQLRFLTHVIGGFAEVLDRCPAMEYAETAGDGLFVVLSDVAAGVECAFELDKVLQPERVAAAGLPAHLGLRLSAHVGPLYRRFDPVIRRDKFCGMEVIRTARIEPVTPVGEIFVTEQFAASLASAAVGRYVCEYVGIQKMAKGFGECRMYSLRHAMD